MLPNILNNNYLNSMLPQYYREQKKNVEETNFLDYSSINKTSATEKQDTFTEKARLPNLTYTNTNTFGIKSNNIKSNTNINNNSNTSQVNSQNAKEEEPKTEYSTDTSNSQELTDAEKQTVKELQRIDNEVRAHEQAHLAAGAGLVRGGAALEYQRGPDGKMYAVAGEVKIDISEGKTPEETIMNMQKVIGAALAPADPSAQDRSVASLARRIEAQARMEKSKETLSEDNAYSPKVNNSLGNDHSNNVDQTEETKETENKDNPKIQNRKADFSVYTQNSQNNEPDYKRLLNMIA
jgi:hypothetical protein